MAPTSVDLMVEFITREWGQVCRLPLGGVEAQKEALYDIVTEKLYRLMTGNEDGYQEVLRRRAVWHGPLAHANPISQGYLDTKARLDSCIDDNGTIMEERIRQQFCL